MIVSVLILTVSLVMLAYWFRYSCLLVLRGNEAQYAGTVAARNQLSFVNVQERLPEASDLDPLERALEKDYRLLSYLLQHSAGADGISLEERMLVIDYRLMQFWYRLVRGSSLGQARAALREMAGILEYFADRMGAHATHHSVAA